MAVHGIETKSVLAAVAALIAAFGIAAPLPNFLAGLFLSMSGAYAAMIVTPPSSRLSFRLTLFMGWLFGLVAAIMHSAMFSGWSLHLIMFGAGFLSRYLATAFVAFGGGLKDRFARAADELKIPGTGKRDE